MTSRPIFPVGPGFHEAICDPTTYPANGNEMKISFLGPMPTALRVIATYWEIIAPSEDFQVRGNRRTEETRRSLRPLAVYIIHLPPDL